MLCTIEVQGVSIDSSRWIRAPNTVFSSPTLVIYGTMYGVYMYSLLRTISIIPCQISQRSTRFCAASYILPLSARPQTGVSRGIFNGGYASMLDGHYEECPPNHIVQGMNLHQFSTRNQPGLPGELAWQVRWARKKLELTNKIIRIKLIPVVSDTSWVVIIGPLDSTTYAVCTRRDKNLVLLPLLSSQGCLFDIYSTGLLNQLPNLSKRL